MLGFGVFYWVEERYERIGKVLGLSLDFNGFKIKFLFKGKVW